MTRHITPPPVTFTDRDFDVVKERMIAALDEHAARNLYPVRVESRKAGALYVIAADFAEVPE